MTCYICQSPETKLCDGVLLEKLINSLTGSCDRPMCNLHAETVKVTYICQRGKKGKSTVITKDLCTDCLAVYQSKKSLF